MVLNTKMNFSGFKNIKFKKRNYCMVCRQQCEEPVISLSKFPLTEIYTDKQFNNNLGFVNQEFHFCERCGHGQLKNIINQEVLYGSSYRTRTSTSSSAILAADFFLDFVNNILKKGNLRTIIEIGCNDLYVLKKLRGKARILYGIDPILKGIEDSHKDKKIKIIGDFFENLDLSSFGSRVDAVLSSHTLEHVEDPKGMIQGLLNLCTNEAILFFQFPGLETLISGAHFDQVFHQHLNYFSLQSVLYLLDEVGAELIEFKLNPYHWGALMIAFRKKPGASKLNRRFKEEAQGLSRGIIEKQYKIFKENIELTVARVDSFKDRTIYGYGAALMFPVLEYYLKRSGRLKYIIDEDESKKDLYYLNVPVQIKMPDQIKDLKSSIVLITAVNSMWAYRAIMKKLISLGVEQIIAPVNLI